MKFHTNIANRWIFYDTKKSNGYHSLFIKLFGHVGGGAFFPDTVYYKKQVGTRCVMLPSLIITDKCHKNEAFPAGDVFDDVLNRPLIILVV